MLDPDDSHHQDVRQIGAIREVPLILDLCRRMTGMGFTAIARVTDGRWITCASLDHLDFGLTPGDELEVESTICHEVRACRETIAIPDVDASEVYRNHHTPRRYGFKSYLSVPIIRSGGEFWGTLCAIDPVARPLPHETLATFGLFAQLLALELDRQDELEAGRIALATERDVGRLREEFIAVVGHDLRNPIAAVSAGLALLSRGSPSDQTAFLIPEMQRALARAGQIVTNLMDFARGRLGVGIEVLAPGPVDLGTVFRAVVREIEQVAAQPITLALDLPQPIRADPQRLGQLLSNLLSNAVTHGAAGAPIRVEASDGDGVLRLSVTNQGPPIPEEVRPSLFLPFVRGDDRANLQGLGLGLYIACEIARAHGGTLDVESSEAEGTTFTLTLPARHD
ncbi:GAF domain-containing sensor histidine kinase [Rubellimicrobium rubrum]|uniref:histidine kinase n=2 Tax=Rubellimicrobium rubrum TaxID=2585369 RepID=A0A5C4MWA3_9RHOB|nr:GAF domain-containing sensor histidine kinase [Rubellimicrobium rubrum]